MNQKTTTTEESLNTLIGQLEEQRSSRVIVYYTGEKAPQQQFATVVGLDTIPSYRKILEGFGKTSKITLVLNTSGGHLETPWPLVNLIREYCDNFEVFVLEKALSAGTMIALGADRIIMLPYSHLSPIDPSADIVDNTKKEVKKFEIEDIVGFIDFAKERVGVAEQAALSEVIKELTKEVNPTFLGSAHRIHSLIRKLARDLLELHRQKLPEKQVQEITQNLTQKLFSHRHLINRREAKDLVGFGKIIEFASDEQKTIANKMLEASMAYLKMNEDFNPEQILGAESETQYVLPRALIHSQEMQYDFTSMYRIGRTTDPSGKQQFAVNEIAAKWSLVE